MKKMQIEAAAGSAGAQFNLGVMLHARPAPEGRTPAEHRAEAIDWLLKAALQGLPRAHGKLAEVYASAPLVPGDEVRACAWYLVAMGSASGIHRHNAATAYERLAARLRPGQVKQAQRDARALARALRQAAPQPA